MCPQSSGNAVTHKADSSLSPPKCKMRETGGVCVCVCVCVRERVWCLVLLMTDSMRWLPCFIRPLSLSLFLLLALSLPIPLLSCDFVFQMEKHTVWRSEPSRHSVTQNSMWLDWTRLDKTCVNRSVYAHTQRGMKGTACVSSVYSPIYLFILRHMCGFIQTHSKSSLYSCWTLNDKTLFFLCPLWIFSQLE